MWVSGLGALQSSGLGPSAAPWQRPTPGMKPSCHWPQGKRGKAKGCTSGSLLSFGPPSRARSRSWVGAWVSSQGSPSPLPPIPSHPLDPSLPPVSWHPQGPGSPVERLRSQGSEGSRGAAPLGPSDCSQGMWKGHSPASIRVGFGADHTILCRDLSQTPSPLG